MTSGDDGSFNITDGLMTNESFNLLNVTILDDDAYLFLNNSSVPSNFNGSDWNSTMEWKTCPSFNWTDQMIKSAVEQGITDHYDMNTDFVHNGIANQLCNFLMVMFIFYLPRTIYVRVSRFDADSQLSCHLIILFLSCIACFGALIHFVAFQFGFQNGLLQNQIESPEDIIMTRFLLKSLQASINRLVSPIVSLLCIQLVTTSTTYNMDLLQSMLVQGVFCGLSTIIVFSYSFFREYQMMVNVDPTSRVYPDRIHVDFYDIIIPLLTTVVFFYARIVLSRQSVYAVDKYSPSEPTALERVMKVVVYQTVMTIATIGAILTLSLSEEDEKCADPSASYMTYFLATAQTPTIHWVLFRSLLRKRKPTRLCFLMCCSTEEKVGIADSGGDVEMNAMPQRANPAVKPKEEVADSDDDGDEDPEDAGETLDPNKIVIMRESEFEAQNGEDPNKEEQPAVPVQNSNQP